MLTPESLVKEHQHLGSQIAEALEVRVREVFGTYKAAGDALSEITDLKKFHGDAKVRDYCTYGPTYDISPTRQKGYGRIIPKNLRRLAALYTLLGLTAEDQIVELTKKINPNFQYPITVEKQNRENVVTEKQPLGKDTEARRPQVTENIEVKVLGADVALTDSQMDNLTRIARLYASRNERP